MSQLEVNSRLEYDVLKSIRSIHGVKGKKIYFSNTSLPNVVIFRTHPDIKFIMKANLGGVFDKKVKKLERKLIAEARKRDSVELVLDLAKLDEWDKLIVYDVTNKTRCRFFSAYPPAINTDVLVVVQDESSGKLGEEELFILAVDHDCIPALAAFQNNNSLFTRGGYPTTKYGSETGFKLFSKLHALKFKIHTYNDVNEYTDLGSPAIGSVVPDENKKELLDIFCSDNSKLLTAGAEDEFKVSEDGGYSLVEIITRGKIPNKREKEDLDVDFELGLDIEESFVKDGWVHFRIKDEDGKFWEDYEKSREELMETLGGLTQITVYKAPATKVTGGLG